jgi:hypothetical protein
MTAVRDEALLAVLDALPTLEEPLVKCMQMCEFAVGETPEEIVRIRFLSTIRQECAEEIIQINADPSIAEFGDFHVTALADFIRDGTQLFDAEERAAMALSSG